MLIDRYGRYIRYLRISVTGRCNLNCVYCRPLGCVETEQPGSELTVKEIAAIARVAAELGISHVRLTGGEPLLRQDLDAIVRALSDIPGIDDLSLTTNGQLLAERAADLADAGLQRVNISMDSLDVERYRRLSGGGELARVWAGVDSARRASLNPVKINVVLVRGENDAEISSFAGLAREQGLHVRFIELLPTGPATGEADALFYPATRALEQLQQYGLGPASRAGPGPAQTWPLGKGTVGIISSFSAPPCCRCNRLRLTSDGKLRPCLTNALEIDLRPALQAPQPEAALAQMFREAAALKPECGAHLLGQWSAGPAMCRIGG